MEWKRDEYRLSDNAEELQFRVVCELLWGTYWAAGRTPKAIQRSVANSMCFGLYAGPHQVGFARVVTDRATVGYLCDVVIAEAHRGGGLGRWMIERILEHPELESCRIDLFTKDAQAFYGRFGFGPHRFTSLVRYPKGNPESGCEEGDGGGR